MNAIPNPDRKKVADELRSIARLCGGDLTLPEDLAEIPGIAQIPWRWCDEREAAAFLGVSVSTLQRDRWAGTGLYPYSKRPGTSGRVTYFPPLLHVKALLNLRRSTSEG